MNLKPRLFTLAFFLAITSVKAQTFQNLLFEQTCENSKTKLCHWDISWNYKVKHCTAAQTDKGQSLLISSLYETGIGFVEQMASIPGSNPFKLVTFSGKIKIQDVVGRGAGVSISTLDQNGNYLFVNDLEKDGQKMFKGTSDWQLFSLQAICSPQTQSIKIGGILYGKGQVWYDDFEVTSIPLENRKPSHIAQEYIKHFCNIVEKHSLRKDSIDLESIKRQGLQIAGPAKTYADCHLAVRHMIGELGDHHSFLMKLETYKDWENAVVESSAIPFSKHQKIEDYAYLSIPGFHSGDEGLKIAYADSIQNALAYYDQESVKGWIIDLRNNDGGNMEPMLAGLGPLFSAKTVGYLVDVNGKKEAWGYKKNAPFSGKEKGTSATNPVKLKNRNLPIAVLVGPQTGSSGEIVVISFIGNKNTRLFGKPTWGISTGNGEFELLDGARLFLTSTVMADRTGKQYGGKVLPDEWIKKENTKEIDFELLEAIKWLKKSKP